MASIGSILVAAVGNLREPHWLAAQQTYAERLKRYTRLEIVGVKDCQGRGIPEDKAMEKEGQALLEAARSSRRRIALTPDGRSMDSPGLAAFLRKEIEQYGQLAFLIGGPAGLSDQALSESPVHLALSPLTFPHEMARVILLEQLYRAFTILGGEKYHK